MPMRALEYGQENVANSELHHKACRQTIIFPLSGIIAHSSELFYSMDQGCITLAGTTKCK
jgi:hypothetical protein